MPRVVRDALVSWDRQEFPIPNIMATLGGGAGKLFERTFDLGEKKAQLLKGVFAMLAAGADAQELVSKSSQLPTSNE